SFCPLEKDARIIGTSTPRFAKIVSHKYAYGGAPEVVKDLSANHGRKIARSFVKGISDLVGAVALAKEESWDYSLPECDVPIHSISIGLDGTYVRMTEGDFHEAMVGSISLYDKEGNRQDSIYVGASPEYGKDRFLERMRKEIARVKGVYKNACYIGLADGARSNWSFLNKHTEHQLIDFYHASEYLHKAATSTYTKKSEHQEKWGWLDDTHHNLKHKKGAAARILNEMTTWQDKKLSDDNREQLESTITYFTNNKSRMRYSFFVDKNLPIGSGVTESACKMIVKQRLCNSGMMWKKEGVDIVMSLRCLTYSGNKWQQFWNKIDQYGYSLAA
ncbi:MAG: ISKra4 family transposase, partial [Candidatus Auribacterota bacterium]|nr:ISKra4 family transposase [Candidatus Auribacterota bacterium]